MSSQDGHTTQRAHYSPDGGMEVTDQGTIFDVPAWREDIRTQLQNGISTITTPHLRVHQGRAFIASVNEASLGNNDTMTIFFNVNSVSPHVVISASGSGPFEVHLYEGTTVTNDTGTLVGIHNKNRNSSTISTVSDNSTPPVVGQAVKDANVISAGLAIRTDFVQEGFLQGGTLDYDREMILKASTSYLFQITSRSVSNRCHLNLEWYETE